MTELEQRLAQRIHNQRARLRQMEAFKFNTLLHRKILECPYKVAYKKLSDENARLRAELYAKQH